MTTQAKVAMLKRAGWHHTKHGWFCPARKPYPKRHWKCATNFNLALAETLFHALKSAIDKQL